MEEGTTTISTIAVQSGSTKIVIALLQVKQWLELRVLEVTPGLTLLGDDLGEATALRNSHYDVIQKVQSKKSPVEELLRQADEAVEREGGGKTRVYAAMADSLTAAWHNVQAHLDTRRNILDLNVEYHRCANEFEENCKTLEKTCSGEIPIEMEELREILERVSALERQVLYSVNQALHHGSSLLEVLQTIKEEGTLDSRPGQIKLQAELAKCQVERWLEGLHERRGYLARRGEETRIKLEGCLSLAVITSDLTRLHHLLEERTDSLLRSFDQLGDAHASAQLLLHEHRKLTPEAKELQEQALKIVKATEEFASEGHFAGPEAISQAYQLLESAATYLHHIDHRETNLLRSIDFFNNAHSAIIKLDQLEVQLTTGDLGLSTTQLEQLHSNIARSLEEVTAAPLQEGYSILQDVPSAEGVKRMVEQMENKKINLGVQCTAHQEENIKANRVYNNFIEKYEKLNTWLMSMESYVSGLQDLGSNLPLASDFLQIHRKNLNDLEVKGNEINALVNSIPSIAESLTDSRREDVVSKGEVLRKGWQDLRTKLEDRVSLAGAYVRAFELAVRLTSELDSLESSMKEPYDEAKGRDSSATAQQIEPQLANTCANFGHDFKKGGGGGVDGAQGRLRLESTLEHLTSRHRCLQAAWALWLQEREQSRAAWDTNMAAATKTVDWVSKLDAQLYPLLSEELVSARQLAGLVEQRHNTMLPEIRRAQQEIQLRIQTTEALVAKGGVNASNEGVPQRLKDLNNKLQMISTDYQILLEKLLTFFNGLSQVETRVEAVKREDETGLEPFTPEEANRRLREFEVTRHTISEMMNLNIIESGHIIARIRSQESDSEKDVRAVKKAVEHLRMEWENLSERRGKRLEQDGEKITFRRDLMDIRRSLDQLVLRLNTYTNYGDSLAQAVAASNAYIIFEKTIQELEVRIVKFTKVGEEKGKEEAEKELSGLKREWESLKEQVTQTRRTIDLTVKYFKLVEEAEDWFREGNRLLMVIARKSTTVRTVEQASELLAEIEAFVKPGEEKQYHRINEINSLAQQLQSRGAFPQMTQVKSDSKEMLESFSQVSSDLKVLREKLQNPEPVVELMETDGIHKTEHFVDHRVSTESMEFTSTSVVHKIEVHKEESLPVSGRKEIPNREEEEEVREKKSPSPPPKKVRYLDELQQTQQPYFTVTLQDATVVEGSKFTFHCRVTGLPIPEIVWEKDGMSIDNNPDYETVFEEGLCSLTIEETFAEDSAVFTCRASNAAGSAQTSASLVVKESCEQTLPPVFVAPVSGSSVVEGGSVKLRCRVAGMPLPTVQWFTGSGTCLENDPKYAITYNNGEATLEKLIPATLEDEGVYCCTAYNPLGSETSMARLTVTRKEPSGVIPTFTLELGNVMARIGEKIKLECEVKGTPDPQFTWTHEGKIIKETSDIKVTVEGSKSTLVISEAFPKHAGLYKVTATNSIGSRESSSQVVVKGPLPTEETSDSEQPSDMEPSRPSVQLHLKDQSVFEGKKVRLDCVIVGHPEPEVIWYHNEKPVKESSDIQLTFQGDRCSLIIKEALLEDAGNYKVVAINSAGEASSECNLSVQAIDKSGEHATRHPVEEKVIEKTGDGEPKFTKMLTDLLVAQGDTMNLEVEVTGAPMPTVTWALNNQDLQQSERIHMSQDNDGRSQLRITSVEAGDKGVYTAKASNQQGEAKCFAQLIVKTPLAEGPQVSSPPDVTKHPPAFSELFTDRAVPEGASTKFECIVTGKPTPKVRWLFNDVPVSGKDFLVSTSGNRQVLTVPNVTISHFGKVTCSAENEAGKSACAAVLSVIEPELDLALPSIDSMNLQESSCKFEMKRAVFMQSSSSQQFSSVSRTGEEPVVQMQSMSSKSEMASQKIGDKPAVQVEKLDTSEYSNIGGVESRSESHVVKSSDHIETQAGKSVITRPQRKSTPPRFISPLTGCIIDQGADVSLQAIVDGYPAPTVAWTKNGSQCPPQAEISWELGKASLKLSNVSTTEAGRYTCTATNPAGTAASTADIVVRKSSFPPVMGRRLQGTTATLGQRICLEVEVTGTPTPTVTWTKGNQPIPTTSSKHRIQSFGNCHSLVIEKAEMSDSGEYSVSAKNSAGEARSTAELLVMQEQPSTTILYQTTMGDSKFQDLNLPKLQPFGTTFGPVKESVMVSESFKSEKQVSIKTEHKSSSFGIDFPSFAQSQIDNEQAKNVEIPVEKVSETVREDDSISEAPIPKKSALDFFKNIIKENEEESKTTKVQEIKLSQPVTSEHSIDKFSQEFQSKSFSKFESTEQHSDFNLEPGPPPEIGFSPKMPAPKTKEDMADRVKKLEESHRKLSETEAPPGGVKIFPTPMTPIEKVSYPLYEAKREVVEETIVPTKIEAPGTGHWTLPDTSPLLRPSANIDVRPESPKPSMEGISMEKIWASSRQQQEQTHFQGVRQEEPRPLSPRPSAEGKAMDKMWAHKHSESTLKTSWPPPLPETITKKVSSESSSFKSVQEFSSKSTAQETSTVDFTRSFQMDETKLPPETKPGIYYVAETRATHSSNIVDRKQMFSSSQTQQDSMISERQVVEENILLPSVAKQIWPQGLPVEVEKKPKVKKEQKPQSCRSHSVQELPFEAMRIEPGPPPEIGFATPPPKERRQSYVETIEQGLEKDLEKEPSRHLVGAVRTIPPPPKKDKSVESIAKFEKTEFSQQSKTEFKRSTSLSENFKAFPTLEPFPFQPEESRAKPVKFGTVPRPSKFVKKSQWGSDYESDLETNRIRVRWTPWDSDTEEPTYRRVKPPQCSPQPKRPHSALPEPTLPLDPPLYYTSKTTSVRQKKMDLRPSSPPQKKAEPKPEAPKVKKNLTTSDSGYMADTDEPRRLKTSQFTQAKQQFQIQTSKKSSFSAIKSVDRKELESPKLISQPVLKPVRTVPFQPIAPHFEEVDSAAIKPRPLIDLKPGSPPKMDYAPPPAGYCETSNTVSFAEATQSSRRVVSMQQTTRVMSYDEGKKTVQSNLPSKVIARGEAKWTTDSESELEDFRRSRVSQQLRPGEPPQYHYAHPPQPAVVASKHLNEMSSAFKSKAQQFVSDVIQDVKQPTFQSKEITKKEEPQIYREESRLAEHGKKHIDPDTGLIYFKYDFGYEFGVVLPGEGGGAKKTIKEAGKEKGREREEGSIEVPVIHETTKQAQPQFKAVKWEPASETELSEGEEVRKGKQGKMIIPTTPSPCSISPSLPSISPYPCHQDQQVRGQSWASETSSPYFYTRSSPVVVSSMANSNIPKRAPIFITPLRDIAVVGGQTARFECIVQAEPAPSVSWAKDGQAIQPSQEHQVHFRNGVCRLTLPQAFQYNAGIYTCTATNSEGKKETSANLKVSGEERTFITK